MKELIVTTERSSMFAVLKEYALRAKRAAPEPVNVLIVDDEEGVLKFVGRVLSDAGYKTTLATDGPDAIRVAAEQGPFDILVTDLMMPEMTGDELGRRLRTSEPRLKVLYLTGFSDRLFKEKATLWEDEAYLDKPCSPKGLLQAVSLLAHGRFDVAQEISQ
jgi:two-component system, cell cycle sensor histidine kinase and response regulator CckA